MQVPKQKHSDADDFTGPVSFPARKSHPVTSHIAAEKIISSGKREAYWLQIMDWLLSRSVFLPNRAITSAELAHHSGIPHPACHKRLPELLRKGKVAHGLPRICKVTGSLSNTWYAVIKATAKPIPAHVEQPGLFE